MHDDVDPGTVQSADGEVGVERVSRVWMEEKRVVGVAVGRVEFVAVQSPLPRGVETAEVQVVSGVSGGGRGIPNKGRGVG